MSEKQQALKCGDILRKNNVESMILMTLNDGVSTINMTVSVNFLVENEYEFSKDGGKTWEPCNKEVTQ